jgi:spore coat polysaccharide biosynthesis protein SpsF (cytidylyltransferase family)
MKSSAIIQARISSTRLPSKALLELCGKPMIFHVIERAKAITGIDRVVLATGNRDENRSLLEIAKQCGIDSYAGSEDDVLERYYMASSGIDCDYVIRITGDNPLTDHDSASSALGFAGENNADHCTISCIPTGTGIEVIKKSALDRAFIEGRDPHQREHVTPYIKEHPELFKSVRFQSQLENPFPDLRLTVDEPEDFELIKIIYNNLYKGMPIKLHEVISFIKQKPELRFINSAIVQRPMTHHSRG